MLKKLILGSLGLMLLSSLVLGRSMWTVATTAVCEARDAVRSEVPVEFEIKRAERMLAKFEPEIRDSLTKIAEQKVDLELLREKVSEKAVALTHQKDVILALRNDLASGETEFVYAGEHFTASDVEGDLADRFDAYRRAERGLKSDQKMLAARERMLRANQEKLEQMLSAKRELEVELVELQAHLKTVEAEEAVSRLAIDDSHLGRTRELIDSIERRVKVREQVRQDEAKFVGRIPYGEQSASDRDVSAEIDTHFDMESADDRQASRPGDAVARELSSF